jgi:hypothetical protein
MFEGKKNEREKEKKVTEDTSPAKGVERCAPNFRPADPSAGSQDRGRPTPCGYVNSLLQGYPGFDPGAAFASASPQRFAVRDR